MSVPTVKTLQERVQQGPALQDYLEGQLNNFDRIINAHPTTYGRNMIRLELPTAPDIAGLERSDAQRVLYAQLAAIYCKRGFDARVSVQKTRSTLFLFFDVKISAEVDASLSRFLHSRTVDEGSDQFRALAGNREPLRRDVPGETAKWMYPGRRPAESRLGPAAPRPVAVPKPMKAPPAPKSSSKGGAGGDS